MLIKYGENMKRFTLVFGLVFWAIFVADVTGADTNVLVIGSSHSYSNDEYSSIARNQQSFNPQLVVDELQTILDGDAAIATANVVFEDIYQSTTRLMFSYNYTVKGYSLLNYYYWPNGKADRMSNLKGEAGTAWDYVVILGDPSFITSTPGVYAKGVKLIVDKVKEGTAKPVLMMQWPHAGSSVPVADFGEVTYRVGDSGGIAVAPAGYAWDALTGKDTGTHPTPKGAYLAAATLYSKMFDRNATTSTYTYDNSLADHAHTNVQTHSSQSHYTGTYTTEDPYQILGEKGRVIKSKGTGSSTEQGYLDYGPYNNNRHIKNLIAPQIYVNDYQNDSSYSGKTHFYLGRHAGGTKAYKVEPATYKYGMGYAYQIRDRDSGTGAGTSDAGLDMIYGLDSLVGNRGDQLVAFDMIKQNYVSSGIRTVPVYSIWATVKDEMGLSDPWFEPTDGRHYDETVNEAVVSYMMTLLTGRCPIGKNDTATERERRRIGYETAWIMSTLNLRAPGYTVHPSSSDAKTVTPGTSELMSVYFVNPPESSVTVNVSVSSATAAIVNPKVLTFDANNHGTVQNVRVIGLPGAASSELFNVSFLTTSSDMCFDGLTDSWEYTNNRTSTESLTLVDQADRQISAAKNGSKSMDLQVTGSSESNTTFAVPFHGTLSWSGSNPVYTPDNDYIGNDSFAFAVNTGGIITRGYIEISIEDLPAVIVVESEGTTDVVEGGATDTYTISLNEAPAANVTVSLSTDSQVTVSPTTLNFTTGNWSSPQTVTVTAVNDVLHEVIHEGIVSHTSSSSDPNWNAILISGLSATITDNDNQAPTVDAGIDQTVTLVEGAGGGSPIAGSYYEWDAGLDTDGNNTWQSTTANTFNWTIDSGNQTPSDVSDTRFDRLTKAYEFPTAKDATNSSFSGSGDSEPATFEFVIDVDGNDGSIFETGGSGDGLQVDMSGGVIRGTVQESTPARVTYTLTPTDLGRFIHVVFVVDSVNDVVELYVDGDLKDSMAWTQSDWAGGDGASLGGVSGTQPTGGSTSDFNGKMSLFRYYRNKAFTPTEVATNFNSLSTGTAVTLNLDGTVSDSDSDPTTTIWTVMNGPGSISIGDSTETDTTATFTEAGSYVLRLTGNDGIDQTFDDLVITVNDATSGNTAPISANGAASVIEDSSVAIVLSATDADGESLSYTVVTAPSNGTLSGTAPNLTYTPTANYNGSDSFTFKANDGAVDSNIGTISITVNGANDAPIASAGTSTVSEDSSVAVILSGSDVDGESLSYTVVTAPSNGALSGTAPNLTYTPTANYNGSDSFTFKANDGTVDSNTATISMAVNAVNDAPVASSDMAVVNEDSSVAIQLSATDIDGDSLSYTVVPPANGSLSGTAPNLTYTPNTGYFGSDSFTFKANDGADDSNIATISITVNEVISNTPPTVDAGVDQSINLTAGAVGGTPLAGSYYEFDAPQDTSGDSVWTSTTANAHSWILGSNQTPLAVSDARFNLLTTAYSLPAAKATGVSFNGNGDQENATFEFVLDVDSANGVIFETGGAWVGMQFDVHNGALRFHVHTGQGITPYTLSVPLTTEDTGRFVHVVGVLDLSSDKMLLYLDGTLADSNTNFIQNDWAGGNEAGLGRINADGASTDATSGKEEGDLTGKMALFRYYRNKAFTASEVTANFNSLSAGSSSIATLDATVIDPEETPTTMWSVVSGPGSVTFGDATAVDTTAVFTVAGSYTLRLTADDGTDQSTDDVVITVSPIVEINYSVTYEGNGSDGGAVPSDANTYSIDEAVTVLGNSGLLSRVGYNFAGWNTALDGSGSDYAAAGSFSITEDVTLYAKWTAIPVYALTVNNGSGDGGYAEGTEVAITASAPVNYHFVNWSGDTSSVADVSSQSTTVTMSASAVTLTANFAIDSYAVEFNIGTNGILSGGGALVQNIDHGSGAIAPTVTANSGYIFTGWSSSFSNVTSALIVNAQYSIDTINSYTVNFVTDERGTGNGELVQLVNEGSSANEPGITPAVGWEFIGWDLASDNVTSDLTVTAMYASIDPKLKMAKVVAVTEAWQTVTLPANYYLPIIVTTPVYSNSVPLVTRIRNVTGTSFELKVQRPTASADPINGIEVTYIAAEAGVYNQVDHGIKLEALLFESKVTDRKNNWVGEDIGYQNSYDLPAVYGQVMTYNDTAWSTFWSNGGSQTTPANSSNLFVGKHVGEDAVTTRQNETLGYIVAESGSYTMNLKEYTFALGSDSIEGYTNTPRSYVAEGDLTIATISAMDGGDGGWAVLYGSAGSLAGSLSLVIDEDQFTDSERGHTTEQVAYITVKNAPE